MCVEGKGWGLTPVPGIPGLGDTPGWSPARLLAGVPVPSAAWLCLDLGLRVSSLPGDQYLAGPGPLPAGGGGWCQPDPPALTTSPILLPALLHSGGPRASLPRAWGSPAPPHTPRGDQGESSSLQPQLGQFLPLLTLVWATAHPGAQPIGPLREGRAGLAPGRRHDEGQPGARTAQKS